MHQLQARRRSEWSCKRRQTVCDLWMLSPVKQWLHCLGINTGYEKISWWSAALWRWKNRWTVSLRSVMELIALLQPKQRTPASASLDRGAITSTDTSFLSISRFAKPSKPLTLSQSFASFAGFFSARALFTHSLASSTFAQKQESCVSPANLLLFFFFQVAASRTSSSPSFHHLSNTSYLLARPWGR
ncbi:hypothetical protein MUK42_28388 [Musa troglodytarum]|uniref:Uncharacterized protein n=1 Tax=Musa troglodytarum TaxID=320322 RepID=A0A9E7F195_9LILI|nr:hypothetical protein MUK42_28388 [Musa troglodytarum]